MKYIILNFSSGFGPFLRTTELAVAVNNLLAEKLGQRLGIIVPLVYGERQKNIMLEMFGDIINRWPAELVLAEELGDFFKPLFYSHDSYQSYLENLIAYGKKVKQSIQNYLSAGLLAKTFSGQTVKVNINEIAFEINRNPKVNLGINPSYYSSFGHASDILERSLAEPAIKLDQAIVKKAVPLFLAIEKKQKIHFISDPATFSYLHNPQAIFNPKTLPYLRNRPVSKYQTEVMTPPSIGIPNKDEAVASRGVYVTVTGIEKLAHLFKEVSNLGLQIYTNRPEIIACSVKASPAALGHKNIILHFARSGWGSGWLSQFTQTPFITPPYDQNDDPEIYFNNISIERLGLGKIYQGQKLSELLEFVDQYKKNVEIINKNIFNIYGTLNGIDYIAANIVKDYLNI